MVEYLVMCSSGLVDFKEEGNFHQVCKFNKEYVREM